MHLAAWFSLPLLGIKVYDVYQRIFLYQYLSFHQSPDHMSTLMAKLWFDQNVESSLSILKREEHEKRLRDLRKELDYIADTDWKYSPVEKYIGKH